VKTNDLIVYEEAKALVDSGDWLFEERLYDELMDLISDRMEELFEESSLHSQERSFRQLVRPAVLELRDTIISTAKSEKGYAFPPPPRPSGPPKPDQMSLRLGKGTILKILPTFHKIKWDALAIIGTIIVVANWSVLILVATGMTTAKSIRDIILALSSSIETLEDPKEFLVFESVADLQSQFSTVVDYDALADGDHERAWGRVAPDTTTIVDFIASYPRRDAVPSEWKVEAVDVWRDDVVETLRGLEKQNILREKDDRWSIVF
jgi:hypothetical protein